MTAKAAWIAVLLASLSIAVAADLCVRPLHPHFSARTLERWALWRHAHPEWHPKIAKLNCPTPSPPHVVLDPVPLPAAAIPPFNVAPQPPIRLTAAIQPHPLPEATYVTSEDWDFPMAFETPDFGYLPPEVGYPPPEVWYPPPGHRPRPPHRRLPEVPEGSSVGLLAVGLAMMAGMRRLGRPKRISRRVL